MRSDGFLTREGEGRKAQWAPSGNFSGLNARAVLRGENGRGTSPYAGEGWGSAVGSGIFLSRDSVEGTLNDAPSLHRFAYAHTNPLRYIDFDGHDPSEATREEQYAALAAANAAEQNACSSGDQAACSSQRAGHAILAALAAPFAAATAVLAVESGAVAAAWEGTAGPLVEATTTIGRTLLARSGLRAALYAASGALARFTDNIITLSDEGNTLAPVSGPLLRQAEREVARATDRAIATTVESPSVAVHMSSAGSGASEQVVVEASEAGTKTVYFHATTDDVAPSVARKIDLSRGRGGQDFDATGQPSFYLTKNEEQASRLAVERARERPGTQPALVRYEVDDAALQSLEGKTFTNTDTTWQDFVRASRSETGGPEHHPFDYVEGPFAINPRDAAKPMSSAPVRGRGHQIAVCTNAAACVFDASNPRIVPIKDKE